MMQSDFAIKLVLYQIIVAQDFLLPRFYCKTANDVYLQPISR